MPATQRALADYEQPESHVFAREPRALDPRDFGELVEAWLDRVVPAADEEPAALHRAMRYAVFSGGKRIRPQLLLHVAAACAATSAETELVVRAACAVELVHAASLVHDDLPCFNDADERRGRPTIHVVAGEATAVLVGDALLALASEVIADAPPRMAKRALSLVRLLAQATGSMWGIIGGQSLELATTEGFSSEQVMRYHVMKTGALFRFAAEAGAVAAGAANNASWARVGQLMGVWYQMADDLLDARAAAEVAGKPVGRDAALGRPSAVHCHGAEHVRARMAQLLDEIRARVSALAVAPDPLLALVEQVHHQCSSPETSPHGPPGASGSWPTPCSH